MFYKNESHEKCFLTWLNSNQKTSSRKKAAVYLLMSDIKLRSLLHRFGYDVLKTIKAGSGQSSSYTILKAAEDIYTSDNNFHLSLYDLASNDIIGQNSFDLIIQALQIARSTTNLFQTNNK